MGFSEASSRNELKGEKRKKSFIIMAKGEIETEPPSPSFPHLCVHGKKRVEEGRKGEGGTTSFLFGVLDGGVHKKKSEILWWWSGVEYHVQK